MAMDRPDIPVVPLREAAEILGKAPRAAESDLRRAGIKSGYPRAVVEWLRDHPGPGQGARTDLRKDTDMAYTDLLHQHRTHPWADDYSGEHGDAVHTARQVAANVINNQRWGVGPEGQPVYDVSGDSGHYLGDVADDSVRCRLGGPIIALHLTHPWGMDQLTEHVYRILLPKAQQWLRLRGYLTKLSEVGRIEADEDVESAAGRMARRGYTVETLREELGDRTPA